MPGPVRRKREEIAEAQSAEARARFATERRLQLAALLVLAALILFGSVLRAGMHNVFLPGWWRVW